MPKRRNIAHCMKNTSSVLRVLLQQATASAGYNLGSQIFEFFKILLQIERSPASPPVIQNLAPEVQSEGRYPS